MLILEHENEPDFLSGGIFGGMQDTSGNSSDSGNGNPFFMGNNDFFNIGNNDSPQNGSDFGIGGDGFQLDFDGAEGGGDNGNDDDGDGGFNFLF